MISAIVTKYVGIALALLGSIVAVFMAGKSSQKTKDIAVANKKEVAQVQTEAVKQVAAVQKQTEIVKVAADETAKVNAMSDPVVDSELQEWIKPRK